MNQYSLSFYADRLISARSEQLQHEAARRRLFVAARNARAAARLHRRAVRIAGRADALAERAAAWTPSAHPSPP